MLHNLLSEVEFIKDNIGKSAPVQPEEPITVPEVAKFLQIEEQTVYRLLRANKIPAHKKFSKWYFYKSEINEYLRAAQ